MSVDISDVLATTRRMSVDISVVLATTGPLIMVHGKRNKQIDIAVPATLPPASLCQPSRSARPCSGYSQARAYFESRGLHLALSPVAVRRIAVEAAEENRVGARALKEVFRQLIRTYEFEPKANAANDSVLLDVPEVEAALEA